MEEKITPPAGPLTALNRLEAAGHEAWFAGGCVRDSLLGLPPGDWDLTTDALPEETLACFADCRCVETGRRHGTITVWVGEEAVEITTYRADGDYEGHRRPKQVRFSRSLKEDLARRDFTVNAMAWHPARGLVDLYGGRDDLRRGILRCVGGPDRRFEEDALRILRCLRFSAALGFAVEPETARALRERRALLREISPERIRDELTRLLCGRDAAAVLRAYSGVIFTVLPELAPMEGCAHDNPYHCFDVWEHTLHALAAAPNRPVLRWAALLHDSGKPAAKFYGDNGVAHFAGHPALSAELAEAVLLRLRFSNRDTEEILGLVRLHDSPLPLSPRRAKKLLGELGAEGMENLFALMRADTLAHAEWAVPRRLEEIAESEALVREILARNEALGLRDLQVNGGDLLGFGVPEGPEIGRILAALLEEVLAGRLPNERAVLLHAARELTAEPGKTSPK